jgi:hypothetical protein
VVLVGQDDREWYWRIRRSESGVGGSGGARVVLAGPVEREWCWRSGRARVVLVGPGEREWCLRVLWSESGVGGSGGARVDQHFHVPSEHEVRYAPLDASLTSTDFADTICTYAEVF